MVFTNCYNKCKHPLKALIFTIIEYLCTFVFN